MRSVLVGAKLESRESEPRLDPQVPERERTESRQAGVWPSAGAPRRQPTISRRTVELAGRASLPSLPVVLGKEPTPGPTVSEGSKSRARPSSGLAVARRDRSLCLKLFAQHRQGARRALCLCSGLTTPRVPEAHAGGPSPARRPDSHPATQPAPTAGPRANRGAESRDATPGPRAQPGCRSRGGSQRGAQPRAARGRHCPGARMRAHARSPDGGAGASGARGVALAADPGLHLHAATPSPFQPATRNQRPNTSWCPCSGPDRATRHPRASHFLPAPSRGGFTFSFLMQSRDPSRAALSEYKVGRKEPRQQPPKLDPFTLGDATEA